MGRHSKKGKKKGKGFIAVIILLVIAAGGFFGFNSWKSHLGDAFIPGSQDVYNITIPSGSSTGRISQILEDNGIVKSASSFKLFVKFSGNDGKLQAGDYSLSPSMDGASLVESLLSGHSTTQWFTVPEGLYVTQVAKLLNEKNGVDYDDFLNEVQNGSFDYEFLNYLDYDGQGYRLEGVLFPNTYDMYLDATAHDFIDRMLKQFDHTFKDEYYTRMNELGLSFRDVLTIASIIEREARIDSDRPLVASVIYNRLAIDMNLQIDATVQYALGEQKDILTYKDIEINSPYNTYLNKGLPPGPICSPGEASIISALYPADTNYYYYVVSEKLDGSHNFSASYDEFLVNKANYQQALKNKQ